MIPRIYQKIVTRFRDIYGPKGEAKLFFAPGRITMMGEHIDYNGGNILSCAIERGTYIVARKRNDRKVNIYAHSQKAKKSILLDNIESATEDMWIKCIKGVLFILIEDKHNISGMDIYLYGDLPYNTSLASSSSLCACFLLATLSTNNINIEDKLELANLSYRGEIQFASHKTSINNYISIFASMKSHLSLYNSQSSEMQHIPYSFNEYSLVVINSNKKRSIADGEYNSRKKECINALKKLKEGKPNINFLCDLSSKDTSLIESSLTPKEQKRVIYAIEENERVKNAVKYIEKEKMKDLAALLTESHNGLRSKYEVSSAELDIIVEECLAMPYVFGAKMIGLGFGGGVLSFIKKEMAEEFIETLYIKYKEQTHRDADVYILKPSDGARIIQIDD